MAVPPPRWPRNGNTRISTCARRSTITAPASIRPITATVPLLVLAGDLDDWGHPVLRCTAYARAVDGDEAVDVHGYPGVYHAFDNPSMPHMVDNTHVMEYNEAAAARQFRPHPRVPGPLGRRSGSAPVPR